MDLPPTTKLRVADASERPLPPRTARTVENVLSDALRQRPHLLADVAKLRASDVEIGAARSALLPKVSLSARQQPFNLPNRCHCQRATSGSQRGAKLSSLARLRLAEM